MKKRMIMACVLGGVTVLTACGSMNNNDTRTRWGGKQANYEAMHQAALNACVNQTAGAAVKLTTPRGENLDATCTPSPKDANTLIAMPNRMLERMRALEAACAGKQVGDSVTLTNPRDASKSKTTTCVMRDGKLMPDFGSKWGGKPRHGYAP